MITVTLNDKSFSVSPLTSLGDFMTQRQITPAGIAVAVNGTAVAPALWSSTPLRDGDSIIVFKAFYGG